MPARPTRLLARLVADSLRQAAFAVRYPQRTRVHLHGSADRAHVERAFEAGVHFLQRHQRADGAWVDFLLPVGLSDIWMAAHVAWVTEAVPHLAAARARAADYLFEVGQRRGAWGFNGAVGHDCDSTAQALLVLHAAGRSVAGWVETLVAAQHESGGFPTFPSQHGVTDGWRAPHPDVTAVVVTALARLATAESARRRALQWLNSLAQSKELIAYWWPGEAYMRWACANLHAAAPGEAPPAPPAHSHRITVPDTPMLITADSKLGLTNPALNETVAGLIALQRRDGSWPCTPCLRLTDPRMLACTPHASGKCYAGRRRMFATAHAVAALWSVLQTGAQGKEIDD
jgi:hypothetical protein